MESVRIVDRFYPRAGLLRRDFDDRYQDPRSTRRDRFVWDYWNVPDQYLLLRTPADQFFKPEEYRRFVDKLLDYGRAKLGCNAISPPWLSLYVDGAFQGLHADVPHGPWAYVYSLTQGKEFEGGETLLLNERVLNYWGSGKFVGNAEKRELMRKIPPKFNRLLVFDPRIPHGVERVEGVRDPRKARLVIHGWFTQPRPYAEGALSPAQVTKWLNAVLDNAPVVSQWAEDGAQGTMILEFYLRASGELKDVRILTNTLRDQQGRAFPWKAGWRELLAGFRSVRAPAKSASTKIVLPLLFEVGK